MDTDAKVKYRHQVQTFNVRNCHITDTEDRRSMTTFYYYYHQSGLQSNIFSKSSYHISKCAANHVISIEVYDGFITSVQVIFVVDTVKCLDS